MHLCTYVWSYVRIHVCINKSPLGYVIDRVEIYLFNLYFVIFIIKKVLLHRIN